VVLSIKVIGSSKFIGGKMKVHVDWGIISADFHELVSACAQGITGTERHKELADRLRDPNEPNRKAAKFSLIVNCVNCEEAVRAAVTTIWQKGSPISFQLHDGTCPECGSEKGFTYQKVDAFHA
jgi:hypothetical protein